MRKIFLSIFLGALVSFHGFTALPVGAHSGRTDAYGCHTCRTNCPSYGLSYGEYHCHNAPAVAPKPATIPAPTVTQKTAPTIFIGIPKTKTQLYQCAIVGNNSSKIYHLKGSSYIRSMVVSGKKCFATEEAAKKAGYRKAASR